MNIEESKIYLGDSYIQAVYLGDTKLKYGDKRRRVVRARYIREHLAYSIMPNGQQDIVRTFIELEAIDSNGDNVARGKSASVQPGYTVYGGTGNVNTITDGNKSAYFSLTPQDRQLAWVQIDLEQVYDLEAINVWHYPDRRKFKGKIEISEDGIKWTTVYNSDVEGEYEETSLGKTHILISTDWIYPKNGFRYVRDVVRGNSDPSYGKEKHWAEIQVLDKDGFNLAQGRPITVTPGYTRNTACGDMTVVTDGNSSIVNTRDYMQLLPSDNNWVYVEVDLGRVFKPKEIKRWHYTKANWKYTSRVMVSEDSIHWYRVFDSLLDGQYADTADGHTVTTNYKDLTEYKQHGIRYVRDWLRGSNVDGYKNWVEVVAFSSSTGNVALSQPVTVTPGFTVVGGVKEEVTDGNINRFIDVQPPNGDWAYVQVDLGQVYMDLESLTIWHYYQDGRRYINRTEISQDGISWKLLHHTRIDGEYSETAQGHNIIIDYPNVVIPELSLTYYPNYSTADKLYETFYVQADDVHVANAILRKATGQLTNIGKGYAIDKDLRSTAIDYIGNNIMVRIFGQSLHSSWTSFSQVEKEYIVNNWFKNNIVN